MTPDDLLDYTGRLNQAAENLTYLAHNTSDDDERKRLLAKAQGVMLALDYLRSYDHD